MTRFLSLALAASILAGCDSTEPELFVQDPIPPEAFVLGAGSFPASNARVAAGANYLNAAARVGVVSVVVGANLALPLAATRAVTKEEPVASEDGGWMWSSTVDVLGSPVDIDLEAEAPEGAELSWRLGTSADAGEPFTFYTATTSFDGRSGAWLLYHPDETGPVLSATFDLHEFGHRELTFRVPSGRPGAGSSVRFLTNLTEQTFDWNDASGGGRALIVWDRDTHAGSITADTYNGGVQACWDGSLQDVDC